MRCNIQDWALYCIELVVQPTLIVLRSFFYFIVIYICLSKRRFKQKLRTVKPFIYLFVIILISIIPNTVAASGKVPSGTKVGNILVENKTDAEIRTIITDEIASWLGQDDIVIEGEFETLTVDPTVVSFDIDATIDELFDKTKRKLSTFFKRPKNVYVPFQATIDEEHPDVLAIKEKPYIDYDAFVNELHNLAINLEHGILSIPYVEGAEIPLETVAELTLDLPSLSNATLDYMINELNGQQIEAKSLFSFFESIETPEKLLKSSEESSFLGTGLYGLFLQADFDIVSRTQQLTLPTYGDKGLNAEVNKKDNKDLVVMNNSDSTYRLKIDKKKDKVTFALEGNEPTYTYDISIENEKEIKPRTIYRYSKRINPGEHEVVQPGSEGLSLQIVRTTFENGDYVGESIVSRDVYLPTPLILLVSPDEIIEEDVEVDLDSEDFLFEEEMTVDKQGNIIRPDGSSGGSILDLLPDDLEGNDIYEQIQDADQAQQRYAEFLDKLLEIYADDLEESRETDLEHIKILEERIAKINADIFMLVNELIKREIIEADFMDKLESGDGK